jgi:GTP cyclohydrolase I
MTKDQLLRHASNEELVAELLNRIDPDPTREDLKETPKRVVKSWLELYAGYKCDPEKILKRFDADGYDEMVLVRDIPMFSTCEHHLLPFHGVAHVAYIPKGGVYGLSKLARVVDCFARRLQTQERICEQVANALYDGGKKCLGAACVIEATHLCMCARGAGKHGTTTVTSKLVGPFRDKPDARAELMNLIFGRRT